MRRHFSSQADRAVLSPSRCGASVIRMAFPTLLLVLGVMGCSDLSGLAGGKQPLPAGIPDQASLRTRAGALALYNTARCDFEECVTTAVTDTATTGTPQISAFAQYAVNSGLLTDELQAGNLGGNQLDYTSPNSPNAIGPSNVYDVRQLPVGGSSVYTLGIGGDYAVLQATRNMAGLAIDALARYDTVDSPALRGYLYAVQGYTELLLADLFCSGVPLSTIDPQGDYAYKPGSTTQQVYQAAIAKFDTALTLSADSATILNMAQIGKGRAYLALGAYDSAAVAVASVPTSYAYQFYVNWGGVGGVGGKFGKSTMADSEGINGLPYLSSGDPRAAGGTWGNNNFFVPQYAPDKYGGALLASANVYRPITVSSGIEARLIQAEAEYHGVATGMGNWLSELNALRQAAITPALPVLADPGSADAQIKLLFHERAFWLYLTGTRQGDLRRLVRNYGYGQSQVYPTGVYPLFGTFSLYGSDVTVAVPDQAERANPLFTGCISRGA